MGWEGRLSNIKIVALITVALTSISLLSGSKSVSSSAGPLAFEKELKYIQDEGSLSHSASSDKSVTRNLRLAFVGDSITRHQHLTLVYYLHAGSWLENEALPNFLEGGYRSHLEHRQAMAARLNYTEACDCFRPEGHYPIERKLKLNRLYENRYWMDKKQNNYITFIQKFGYWPSQGHWDPATVYNVETHANLSYKENIHTQAMLPYLWENYTWSQVIREHLAKIVPKPNYVVLNAGLWVHDLDKVVLSEIREALDDTGMIGIYRTTAKTRYENTKTILPYEQLACRLLHFCHDVSWTGNVTRDEYMDDKHFRANINRKISEQLLELVIKIKNIESTAAE